MKNNIDYNYNKADFSVFERKRTFDIKNDEGLLIARVNLRYPTINKEELNETGKKEFNNFFESLADEFYTYFKEKIMKNIIPRKIGSSPYSAVMRFIPTFENEEYLSLVIDTFIFSEKGLSPTRRISFTFSKPNLEIVIIDDLFELNKDLKSKILENSNFKKRKHKIKNNLNNLQFYLVPKGLVILLNNNMERESDIFLIEQ